MSYKKRYSYFILALLWMIIIFRFSADPASDSSKKSLGIGYVVADLFVGGFDTWTPEEQEVYVEGIEYPIRKSGHAVEYSILGFLCMGLAASFADKGKLLWLVGAAWSGSALYAATDEFHQFFVPGRSCQFTDVCLDSVGAAVGIIVFFLLRRLFCGKLIKKQ